MQKTFCERCKIEYDGLRICPSCGDTLHDSKNCDLKPSLEASKK